MVVNVLHEHWYKRRLTLQSLRTQYSTPPYFFKTLHVSAWRNFLENIVNYRKIPVYLTRVWKVANAYRLDDRIFRVVIEVMNHQASNVYARPCEVVNVVK